MSHSRREFLLGSTSLVAGFALGKRALAPVRSSSVFAWETLRDDVWMVTGAGGNVTVIREGDGALVVDTKSPGFGPLLRADVEERVGPVRALVVTHHHGDHLGGAYAFDGIRSAAQRKLVPRAAESHVQALGRMHTDSTQWASRYLEGLRRDFVVPVSPDVDRGVGSYISGLRSGSIKAWTPTQSVETNDTFAVGRTTLELHHVGNGHTDNDLYIVDPKRDLVIAGDLLFHRHHPFIDVQAGATTAGWQASLAEMMRQCRASTVVVSGHGTASDRRGLEQQSRYFDDVRALVRKARAEGKTSEEVRKLPPGQFATFGFADGWEDNLRVVYEELARDT